MHLRVKELTIQTIKLSITNDLLMFSTKNQTILNKIIVIRIKKVLRKLKLAFFKLHTRKYLLHQTKSKNIL